MKANLYAAGAVLIIAAFGPGSSLAQEHTENQAVTHKSCSPATLKGSFGFGGIGSVVVAPGMTIPLAVTGRIVADGNGQLSGTQTRVRDGVLVRETFTGVYDVTPDCTGSDILYFAGRPPITRDFVVVGRGEEIRYIVTGSLPGAVITINATRQHSGRERGED